MDFNEIDRILDGVPVRSGDTYRPRRIEALTRIVLAMFAYCSASPVCSGADAGLKYYLYLQDKLFAGLHQAVQDTRIAAADRIVFAREYLRVRHESGAVWNTDDTRLARSEAAIRELLAVSIAATGEVWRADRASAGPELLRRCELLCLLTLYARYADEVPMAWKGLLDTQIEAWTAALDGRGRWPGLTTDQALMRLGVLARYRRTFPAAYDLTPAHNAYLGEAMARIPAAGSSWEIAVLYDVLCENIDAAALENIGRLRELLEGRMNRRARFTDSTYPADVADARLAVKSICIEIACRDIN